MDDERTGVLVRIVEEAETDAGELDALTTKLRRDLLELDVDAVSRPRIGAPDGARGVDAALVGALMIKVAASANMLSAIVRAVRSWLSRHEGRRIKLEIQGDTIEVTGASSDQQERLIATWIERHAEG